MTILSFCDHYSILLYKTDFSMPYAIYVMIYVKIFQCHICHLRNELAVSAMDLMYLFLSFVVHFKVEFEWNDERDS